MIVMAKEEEEEIVVVQDETFVFLLFLLLWVAQGRKCLRRQGDESRWPAGSGPAWQGGHSSWAKSRAHCSPPPSVCSLLKRVCSYEPPMRYICISLVDNDADGATGSNQRRLRRESVFSRPVFLVERKLASITGEDECWRECARPGDESP
ncbi:hypothetical protein E2C01_023814 [Portunus trituberculatus]|uniref:Uncharacterized protein n=1 Tax=Portunus trituberculatus TaxID=210409 RepID=A0A5B7EB01_PORTR|nr:hypothetical protein [Portunus trituberculatus]